MSRSEPDDELDQILRSLEKPSKQYDELDELDDLFGGPSRKGPVGRKLPTTKSYDDFDDLDFEKPVPSSRRIPPKYDADLDDFLESLGEPKQVQSRRRPASRSEPLHEPLTGPDVGAVSPRRITTGPPSPYSTSKDTRVRLSFAVGPQSKATKQKQLDIYRQVAEFTLHFDGSTETTADVRSVLRKLGYNPDLVSDFFPSGSETLLKFYRGPTHIPIIGPTRVPTPNKRNDEIELREIRDRIAVQQREKDQAERQIARLKEKAAILSGKPQSDDELYDITDF